MKTYQNQHLREVRIQNLTLGLYISDLIEQRARRVLETKRPARKKVKVYPNYMILIQNQKKKPVKKSRGVSKLSDSDSDSEKPMKGGAKKSKSQDSKNNNSKSKGAKGSKGGKGSKGKTEKKEKKEKLEGVDHVILN